MVLMVVVLCIVVLMLTDVDNNYGGAVCIFLMHTEG